MENDNTRLCFVEENEFTIKLTNASYLSFWRFNLKKKLFWEKLYDV